MLPGYGRAGNNWCVLVGGESMVCVSMEKGYYDPEIGLLHLELYYYEG